MGLPSIPELVTKAKAAFKRFPLTLLWAITGSLLVVSILEINDSALFNEYLNVFLVLALGISWLISVQFYIEQFANPRKYWWTKAIVLLFLIGVYITLPSQEEREMAAASYIRYILFIIAGHLAIFFAPFTYSWHDKSYANYLGTILISIARSTLFTGVLYLGLVLALAAVDFLFKVDIDGKRYGQLFVLCIGIVNTWVYLSDFPKEVHHHIHFSFPKPAEVFVKFILIPLVALYYIILYAYSFKIIINWELPNGWVSYLVTALAGLLFIIQLIIHPIHKSHPSRLIRKFHPLFYWLLLPLLILLFVAIYRRTSEYGITENRYFVWVLAFYILATTLYLLISTKRHLRWLPIALFVIALATSVGPWGASAVSIRSQVKTFERLYDNAFAKAQTQNKILPQQENDRLRSVTRFLADRNALDKTSAILGYTPSKVFKSSSKWQLPYKIIDTLGLELLNNNTSNSRPYFYSDNNQTIVLNDIDYYKALDISSSSAETPFNTIHLYQIRLSESRDTLLVSQEKEVQLKLPLKKMIANLQKLNQDSNQVPREKLMVQGSNESLEVAVYFQSISLDSGNLNTLENYSRADVFLKELTND
jgi:hypothetical protein